MFYPFCNIFKERPTGVPASECFTPKNEIHPFKMHSHTMFKNLNFGRLWNGLQRKVRFKNSNSNLPQVLLNDGVQKLCSDKLRKIRFFMKRCFTAPVMRVWFSLLKSYVPLDLDIGKLETVREQSTRGPSTSFSTMFIPFQKT